MTVTVADIQQAMDTLRELDELRDKLATISKVDFVSAWSVSGCGGVGSHRDYIDGRAWPWFRDDPVDFLQSYGGNGHMQLREKLIEMALEPNRDVKRIRRLEQALGAECEGE